MKPLFTLVFAVLFPFALAAQASDGTAATTEAAVAPGLQIMDAREIDVRDFVWNHRIIVVMADTPDNPLFARQIGALRESEDEFLQRDVVVVFDAHPADRSPLRQVLRPRGFVTAIIDKDGEVKARRPSFRTARELLAVIDRFPTRRQEVLERAPAGR